MSKFSNPVVPPQVTNTKKISDQLVAWFQAEKPAADFIEVVPGSIKVVDEKFHLYKALVHTDVYLGGVKQHISNIRFRTDAANNLISNTVKFHEQ